jgi:hypothetical protein
MRCGRSPPTVAREARDSAPHGLKICPGSSARNVMDFTYDIYSDSDGGARRDAHLEGRFAEGDGSTPCTCLAAHWLPFICFDQPAEM